MAKQLSKGYFRVDASGKGLPIDSRSVVEKETDIANINNAYMGMQVYDTGSQKWYCVTEITSTTISDSTVDKPSKWQIVPTENDIDTKISNNQSSITTFIDNQISQAIQNAENKTSLEKQISNLSTKITQLETNLKNAYFDRGSKFDFLSQADTWGNSLSYESGRTENNEIIPSQIIPFNDDFFEYGITTYDDDSNTFKFDVTIKPKEIFKMWYTPKNIYTRTTSLGRLNDATSKSLTVKDTYQEELLEFLTEGNNGDAVYSSACIDNQYWENKMIMPTSSLTSAALSTQYHPYRENTTNINSCTGNSVTRIPITPTGNTSSGHYFEINYKNTDKIKVGRLLVPIKGYKRRDYVNEFDKEHGFTSQEPSDTKDVALSSDFFASVRNVVIYGFIDDTMTVGDYSLSVKEEVISGITPSSPLDGGYNTNTSQTKTFVNNNYFTELKDIENTTEKVQQKINTDINNASEDYYYYIGQYFYALDENDKPTFWKINSFEGVDIEYVSTGTERVHVDSVVKVEDKEELDLVNELYEMGVNNTDDGKLFYTQTRQVSDNSKNYNVYFKNTVKYNKLVFKHDDVEIDETNDDYSQLFTNFVEDAIQEGTLKIAVSSKGKFEIEFPSNLSSNPYFFLAMVDDFGKITHANGITGQTNYKQASFDTVCERLWYYDKNESPTEVTDLYEFKKSNKNILRINGKKFNSKFQRATAFDILPLSVSEQEKFKTRDMDVFYLRQNQATTGDTFSVYTSYENFDDTSKNKFTITLTTTSGTPATTSFTRDQYAEFYSTANIYLDMPQDSYKCVGYFNSNPLSAEHGPIFVNTLYGKTIPLPLETQCLTYNILSNHKNTYRGHELNNKFKFNYQIWKIRDNTFGNNSPLNKFFTTNGFKSLYDNNVTLVTPWTLEGYDEIEYYVALDKHVIYTYDEEGNVTKTEEQDNGCCSDITKLFGEGLYNPIFIKENGNTDAKYLYTNKTSEESLTMVKEYLTTVINDDYKNKFDSFKNSTAYITYLSSIAKDKYTGTTSWGDLTTDDQNTFKEQFINENKDSDLLVPVNEIFDEIVKGYKRKVYRFNCQNYMIYGLNLIYDNEVEGVVYYKVEITVGESAEWIKSIAYYQKYGASEFSKDAYNFKEIEKAYYGEEVSQTDKPFTINKGKLPFMPNDLLKINMTCEFDEIPNYGFAYCHYIQGIFLPTQISYIGKYAFSNCSSLLEVFLPTSVSRIDSYAFLDCKKLKKVIVPSSVYSIGLYAFAGCPITSLTIANTDSYGLSLGQGAFCNSNLGNIYIGNTGGSNGNENAFNGKSDVTDANGNILWTANLNDITDGTYYLDRTIKVINDTAFYGVTNTNGDTLANRLKKVEFTEDKDAITPQLKTIRTRAFCQCKNLSEFPFNDCLNLAYIGPYAFEGTNLNSLTFSKEIDSLEIDYCAFMNTPITSITVPEQVIKIGESAFASDELQSVTFKGHFIGGCNDCPSLTTTNWDMVSKYVTIGNKAFYNSTNLKQINLPSEYNLSDYNFTLEGGYHFTNTQIDLETRCKILAKHMNINDRKNTIPDGYFMNCEDLIDLTAYTLPISQDTLSSIGNNAFNGCKKLKTITKKGNVINTFDEISTINEGAFKMCESLEELHFKPHLSSSFDIKSGAFEKAKISKELEIDTKCPSINIYGNAFASSEIKKLTIPWKNVTSIGGYAFCGASGDAVLNLNEATKVNFIGELTFCGCGMKLPSDLNMTNVTDYCNSCFANTNITTVTFSDKCEYIGPSAFGGIELNKVTFASLASFKKIQFRQYSYEKMSAMTNDTNDFEKLVKNYCSGCFSHVQNVYFGNENANITDNNLKTFINIVLNTNL